VKMGEKLPIRTLLESMRLEAYVEEKLAEVKVCALCGRLGYRKLPMRRIGARYICAECLAQLKDAIENYDAWLEEVKEEEEARKSLEKRLEELTR